MNRMHYIVLAILLLSLTGHFFEMRIIRVQRNIIDLLEATAKKQTAALADLNARCLRGDMMEPVTPASAYDKAPNAPWINCLTSDAKGAPVPCKPSGWRFIGDPPIQNEGNGGGKIGTATLCKVRDGSPRLEGEPPFCTQEEAVPSWKSKTLAEWCSPENMEKFYKENPNAGNGGDSPFRDCLNQEINQHRRTN